MNNKFNEEKLHATDESELYRYDAIYRAIKFERGTLNVAKNAIAVPSFNVPLQSQWKLDGVGNWRQVDNETRQHSSFNEITVRSASITTAILSDDNGNETDDGTFVFEWDYSDRLRTITRKADKAPVAVYSYDPVGRRIRKILSNSNSVDSTMNFYYDGWQVIEERDTADMLVKQYVYGNYIDEPLVLDRNLDGDDSATSSGDTRLFYHQNTLYSVFALTDVTGSIVEGNQYDAYGRQTVFAPGSNGIVDFSGDDVVTVGGTSLQYNPYLFTGRRLDSESGLYYYRHRYMDPALGRFIVRDPLGTRKDKLGSTFSYAGSNPFKLVDPLGLKETWAEWTKRWGGAIGSLVYDSDTGAILPSLKATVFMFGNQVTLGLIDAVDEAATEAQHAAGMSAGMRTAHNVIGKVTIIAAGSAYGLAKAGADVVLIEGAATMGPLAGVGPLPAGVVVKGGVLYKGGSVVGTVATGMFQPGEDVTPEQISEFLSMEDILEHGEPSTWTYQHEEGRKEAYDWKDEYPGAEHFYEFYVDEHGWLLKLHLVTCNKDRDLLYLKIEKLKKIRK